jgi:hypothetical protein
MALIALLAVGLQQLLAASVVKAYSGTVLQLCRVR